MMQAHGGSASKRMTIEKAAGTDGGRNAFPIGRILAVGITLFVAIFAGVIAFMLLSDRMILRSPVLVLSRPRVTFALGESSYRERADGPWRRVAIGSAIGEGCEVKTGPGALLDLHLHDGTTVRIMQNTHAKLLRHVIKELHVEVSGGSLYGRFKKIFTEHQMRISTPTSTVAVRGTEIGVEVARIAPPAAPKEKPARRGRASRAAVPAPVPVETVVSTTVYGLSGVVEVVNPLFPDRPVLLGNRNMVRVVASAPPSDPERMSENDIIRVQTIINALHDEEVLLITNRIYFETDSAAILANSHPELDRVVALMNKRRAKVRIEGHTDITGSASINLPLSRRRADSIRQYLIAKGIDPKMLMIAGYGSGKPIADNRTPEGRAQNRRVEFIVIE